MILSTLLSNWIAINTSASAGDEPTELATDERTYLTVSAAIAAAASGDGKISIHQFPKVPETSANTITLRCIGITDNNSVTYSIYTGNLGNADDCNLSYIGSLAFTIGAQASTESTYELADTLTVTEGENLFSWAVKSPANDRVAEASVDLCGADLIVVVPTTLGCDAKLLARFF